MAGELFLFPIPDTWEQITLGEIVRRGDGTIQTGPFGSQLHASDYKPAGVPFVMPINIGDNQITEDGIARISEADAIRLSRYRIQEGDIIYSRRGDVERRSLARTKHEGWICGSGCLMVRVGTGIVDPEYASYYLGHPIVREWIVRHAVGATMPNLNTSIMAALPFLLPPLPEQRAIAHILGALDDKIELNRRMNATLEGMARALFQSWFVDFDPVRAKLRGQQPAGLAPEIAALFPNALVETELGAAPVGWRMIGLNEIATFLNGLALQKHPPENGDSLPVIKIAQLRKGNTEGADSASNAIAEAYVVEDGDVLFSWSGSLECILWTGGRGALNQHLFKVTSDRFPKWFYYLWIHQHLPWFQAIAAGKATTMGHIQRHHLTEAKVAVPPQTTLVHADQVLGPMMDALVTRALESRTLATLRDTLLPRLISGQLRVADAERIAGRSI
jgi:type I restriction enzyme S subunit